MTFARMERRAHDAPADQHAPAEASDTVNSLPFREGRCPLHRSAGAAVRRFS